MQTIRVHGASVEGTGALIVTVEARFTASKDNEATEVHLTGLPDSVLRETRGRLLCILGATRLGLGGGRLYLHLTPAARRKSGEALDLALVLAAAAAGGHISSRHLQGIVFVGEVGIDGSLHGVPGGLASAVAARARSLTRLVAPTATAKEAAAIEGVDAFGAESVREVLALLTRAPTEGNAPAPLKPDALDPRTGRDPCTLDDVRGQEEAKLALQVAAAGGHGLLFVGPPGAGKSMLARRLIDLLPPMDLDARIDVTSILSATGRWPKCLVSRRPFRAPHHTTSFAGLIGGGSPIQPGEISMAHHGVLFLDELPEFGRETLEGLRQPLEEGVVHLARAARRTSLPACFQLVAAMNPCPCGYAGHPRIPCHCATGTVRRYVQRISGPLMDRIELRVSLQPAPVEVLMGSGTGPTGGRTGTSLGEEVLEARARATSRKGQESPINARLTPGELDTVASLETEALRLLERAATGQELSARAIQAVRRVSRTVADLRGETSINAAAVAMALGLRASI